MRDLLVITPTRGRPGNAQRLIAAVAATTILDTDLILATDDDDPSYAGLELGTALRYHGPRRSCAEWTSQIAVQLAGKYRAVASLSDDHLPITPGWDRLLLDALASRPGVAYGNDLYQGERLPTAVVISAPVIAALGYMTPPGVKHLYMDTFWHRLGADLNCLEYRPDVIIEHLHPSAGKASWDEGYARVNSFQCYTDGEAAYEAFLAGRWPGDLARLRAELGAG